ncbi:MAG: hypothetical protein Tp1124DCM412261_27 [Prokaryotic dsDNA virus sp.]|nr:MAG: hypothetical protein Tp1123DCM939791_7 [Prokaryotic dsDNA virus sp.]QDP59859.1 MAG: hypothetical protein Tp1124DCM412261_27 [Prokaryotic dsDNA virus sp.]|tara:strand:+ start:6652 stop:6867 length:216 start_codon:yes stop_codon:yes gene_type:complete
MAMEEDYGYEVDASIKKIKGKTAKVLKVKLLKPKNKSNTSGGVRIKKKKLGASSVALREINREMQDNPGTE